MKFNLDSYLLQKLLQFSGLYILIQSIPVLVEPIVDLLTTKNGTTTYEPIDLVTVLLLSGSAWLSVPSYIDSFEWSKKTSALFRRFALIIGICIILIGGFFKAIQSSGSEILPNVSENISVGLLSLVIALLYIVIAHNNVLKKVTVRLLWKHQSQFAGIYAAKESGIFEKAGLNVQIKKPEINANPVYDFDGSDDDFAIVAGMDVVRMRDNNQKIRSILPIVKVNPFTIIAKQDGTIKSIQDLKGKRVAIQKGYETEIYFSELVKQSGLSLNDFKIIDAEYDYELFYKEEVDIWLGYDGHEPQLFRRRNIPIIEFKLMEYDMPGFGDTLVTEESTISTYKSLVRSFVDSVLRGWNYAKENRERTLKYVLRYSEEDDKKFEKNSLNTMIDHIFHQEKHINTSQDVRDWIETIELLENAGQIRNKIEPSRLFCNI